MFNKALNCNSLHIFTRVVLCCLTWNSLRTEALCRQHIDDVHLTHHQHFVCEASTLFLMISMSLNYLLMSQEFIIEWNLWQKFWIILFHNHVNYLQHNLCWWFSLHIASRHCLHFICMFTSYAEHQEQYRWLAHKVWMMCPFRHSLQMRYGQHLLVQTTCTHAHNI